MAKGEKAFSDDELKDIYKSFFNDGEAKEIVILAKEKIDAVGRDSGKPYVRVDWTLADAKTGETKEIKFDFNFTNAMHEFAKEMKLETSVYKVTPMKSGERNGYPVFDYDVEYMGEDGAVPSVSATPSATVPF